MSCNKPVGKHNCFIITLWTKGLARTSGVASWGVWMKLSHTKSVQEKVISFEKNYLLLFITEFIIEFFENINMHKEGEKLL